MYLKIEWVKPVTSFCMNKTSYIHTSSHKCIDVLPWQQTRACVPQKCGV